MTPTAIAATAKPPSAPRQLIRPGVLRCPSCPSCPWMRRAGSCGGRSGNRRNATLGRLEPSRYHIATVAGLAQGLVLGDGRDCRGRCCRWRRWIRPTTAARAPATLTPKETHPIRIHVVMATSGPHPCRWGRAWDGGWQGSGSPGAPGAPATRQGR